MVNLKIIDELKLIYFEPDDILTLESIFKYIAQSEVYKVDTSEYKRFANFSKIDSKKFTFAEIKVTASALKKFRGYKSKAKSCLYCKDKGHQNMSNIFIEKMKPEFTNYFASTKLEECSEYLDMDIEVLKKLLFQKPIDPTTDLPDKT